jgi:hypothetical protein
LASPPAWASGSRCGFTLIELLVVIAIIKQILLANMMHMTNYDGKLCPGWTMNWTGDGHAARPGRHQLRLLRRPREVHAVGPVDAAELRRLYAVARTVSSAAASGPG